MVDHHTMLVTEKYVLRSIISNTNRFNKIKQYNLSGYLTLTITLISRLSSAKIVGNSIGRSRTFKLSISMFILLVRSEDRSFN